MDTKTALLDAAEKAARMHGHDGFSFGDLSKTVGIRKASIHYHFPTKADLLTAMMTRYRENIIEYVSTLETKYPKASDQLIAYIDIYRNALSGGDTLCLCVALSIGRDGLTEDVQKELTLFRQAGTKWLTGVFERAQSDGSIANVGAPSDEAKLCQALVEGAQLVARAEKQPELFDHAIKLLLDRCN